MKTRLALSISLLLALLLFIPVMAASIIVDGDPSDWPADTHRFTDSTAANGDNPLTPAGADLTQIYFQNSASNMYWRFDTSATTEWDQIATVAICMDTDNNAQNNVAFGPCSSADYFIALDAILGTAELWKTADGAPTNAAVQVAAEDQVTEIGVALADLGMATTCNLVTSCTVQTQIVLESGNYDLAETELVPNDGTVAVVLSNPPWRLWMTFVSQQVKKPLSWLRWLR
jgi:hypothetical protein